MSRFVLAAACNSQEILERNLESSPAVSEANVPLCTEWHAESAASAYNKILDNTESEIVVFLHQDVFLPLGWESVLESRIEEIENLDPNWAILGAFGVDKQCQGYGPVWSSSLGSIVGRVAMQPTPVQSLDEMLIVFRRSSLLRFDEELVGWHMYGTDIVQTAVSQGAGAYATALPCIHNDVFHDNLGEEFDAGYRFIQKKWREQLPICTPVAKVSRLSLHWRRAKKRSLQSTDFRRKMAVDNALHPAFLAARCGWGDLRTNVE